MRAWLAVVALAVAGCSSTPSDVPVAGTTLPGLDDYTGCPVIKGHVHACEPSEDSPYLVDVRGSVPPAWTCLTFADDRFTTDVFGNARYPYPDWYTYYGPVIGDGGVSGAMGIGLLYDAHGDADAVGGAMVIDTEDDERVFVWEGPAKGFVQLPTPIESEEMRVYGVLYPAGPTQGVHADEGDVVPPGRSWQSEPAVDHREFWSPGTFDDSGGYSSIGPVPEVQWNLVHNVDVAGTTVHLPAARNHTVGLGPSDGSGMAHWGWTRASPFNTSVALDGLKVTASVQPYLEFYAEFHDLGDRSALLTSHFLCGCPDPTVASWVADPAMAVQCLAGTPLPTMLADGRGMHVKLG